MPIWQATKIVAPFIENTNQAVKTFFVLYKTTTSICHIYRVFPGCYILLVKDRHYTDSCFSCGFPFHINSQNNLTSIKSSDNQ